MGSTGRQGPAPGAKPGPAGPRGNAFEAFIYAWISFNGWASCCLADERDTILVKVLSTELSLSDTFNDLVHTDPQFASAVQRFHALWPIFRTVDVRDAQQSGESRAARVERYAIARPATRSAQ